MRSRQTTGFSNSHIIKLPRINESAPPTLRVLAVTNMWPTEEQPIKGVFCERQMRSLAKHNIAVDVLSIAGREHAVASIRPYFHAAWRVLKLNWEPPRYDLIHAHTGHCGVVAALQMRYPVVLSYVGYDLDTPSEDREGFRTAAERRLFRRLSRYFAATIAKSARGARHLPADGQARNSVIPNGVDRELFAPRDRRAARVAIGWGGDDRPVALFVADPQRATKRLELAKAAVALAQEEVPDLELRVCGDTPPSLIPDAMSAADVLILTSVAEGSPNVVKEALACNLPVVTVDVGDVRENLERVRHCHVCRSDPERLASAIVSVVRARPERSNGRDLSEHLGLDSIAQCLAAVYDTTSRSGPGLRGARRGGTGARPANGHADPHTHERSWRLR